MMNIQTVRGDLLDQPVEVIVNAWNRNIIPWWLLLPQGVSGAIKRRGGLEPFRELARLGQIPLGGAVITSAGKLTFKAIIHVAGINLFWRSSKQSVQNSVRNSMKLIIENGYQSVAFPLIGAGSGGGDEATVLSWMTEELGKIEFEGQIILVIYEKRRKIQET
jgi:O-acetyl-ADP-ribose deacetylase (regulator of RNase III)